MADLGQSYLVPRTLLEGGVEQNYTVLGNTHPQRDTKLHEYISKSILNTIILLFIY